MARGARKPIDPVTRLWPKVVKTETCWVWVGARSKSGYGTFHLNHRSLLVHRYVYELVVGPIPKGLTLDHLCRQPLCVNPDHLEPVTQRENTLRGTSPVADNARKTTCPVGHPYDTQNTYRSSTGKRHCRICNLVAVKSYQERNGRPWRDHKTY